MIFKNFIFLMLFGSIFLRKVVGFLGILIVIFHVMGVIIFMMIFVIFFELKRNFIIHFSLYYFILWIAVIIYDWSWLNYFN